MAGGADPLEYDKIMAGKNLDDIVDRLEGCKALVLALCQFAEASVVSGPALSGVADLLGGILRDLEADIAAAEDC